MRSDARLAARPRGLGRLLGIGHLPEEVARQLVRTVFEQRASQVLSAGVTVAFGLTAFEGTGSRWYLLGSLYAALVAIWRYGQSVAFARGEGGVSAEGWAMRNLCSGWAVAVGWAGWSLALPLEPNPAIGAVVLGLHAGLTSGGAYRNGAVPAIASGQIIIASVPMAAACLATDDFYLHAYLVVVVLFILAAFSISRSVHRQTVEVLLRQKQASDLAEELALLNECLAEQATIDPLTNLLNRRALDIALSREWRTASQTGEALSVLMIDIDHFKAFNDRYGHPAGDECLRMVASVIREAAAGRRDVVARFGGEEFTVLLPQAGSEAAALVAGRILAELADRAMPHEGAPSCIVSASIGLSSLDAGPVAGSAELIARADAALYEAKQRGRNQVAHAVRAGEPAET